MTGTGWCQPDVLNRPYFGKAFARSISNAYRADEFSIETLHVLYDLFILRMYLQPKGLSNRGVHMMGDKSQKDKDKGKKQKAVKDGKDALEKQGKHEGASANEENSPASK